MEQLTLDLGKKEENAKCRLCSERATWFDCKSGYCDKHFPHYHDMGIDKKKFLKKKSRQK